MRNLKRVLSLLMAAAMLIGMMVISAGAVGTYEDFTDKGEIQNKEAVSTLVTLGVFEGTEKGTFEPARTVTRAEMAKIIAVCLNGGRDPLMGTAANTQFADVGDNYNWAKPYINYCATLGIIAGRGDGNFGPGDEVTCEEAAKMFLCALGYDAEKEGFVGVGWNHGVNVKANQVGMYNNLPAGLTLSDGLSRDNTALLTYNGVRIPMVRYNNGVAEERVNSYVADGNTVTEKITMLDETFKVEKEPGDPDDFGRPGQSWTYNDKEIGFAADAPTATFTGRFSARDLYNALGRNVVNNLSATATSTASDYEVVYVLDGTTVSGLWHNNGRADADYNLVTELANARTSTATNLGENGMQVEVYVTAGKKASGSNPAESGKVTVVMVNTYLAQVNGEYNTNRDQLSLSVKLVNTTKTVSGEDFANLDTFQDKDWVLITMAQGNVKSIELADTVTGAVDSYISGSRITVDGNAYNYSAKNAAAAIVDDDLGSEVTLILDNYGYVIGMEKGTGGKNDNYVFLNKFASAGTGFAAVYQAEAFFSDGTRQIITLNQVDGARPNSESTTSITPDGKSAVHPGWFTYTTTSDGQYNVTPVASANTSGSNTAAAAKKINTGVNVTTNGAAGIVTSTNPSTTTISGNNSTVFVLKGSGDRITVYTGVRNVPTVAATNSTNTTVWAVTNNGYATYVFVDLGNATPVGGAGTSSDHVVILDSSPMVSGSGSNRRYTYKAIVDGDYGDDISAVATKNDLFHGRGLYTVTYNADGEINDASALALGGSGAIRGWSVTDATVSYSDGTLTVAGIGALILSDDCNVLMIEDDTHVTTTDASALASRYSSSGTERLTGVVYAVYSNSAVTDLYVDVAVAREVTGGEAGDALNEANVQEVVVSSGTIANPVTVPDGKSLVIENGATVSGNVTASANSTVEIKTANVTGAIEAKNGSEVVISSAVSAENALKVEPTATVTVKAGGSMTIAATGDVDGTVKVENGGSLTTKAVIDGKVELDGGSLTLASGVTTLPSSVTGTGSVTLTSAIAFTETEAGNPGGVVEMLGEDNITNTPTNGTGTFTPGVQFSGAKINDWSSVFGMTEWAGHMGSTSVSFQMFILKYDVAGTVKGYYTTDGATWVRIWDGFGGGNGSTDDSVAGRSVDAGEEYGVLVPVGDKVTAIKYVYTPTGGSTSSETIFNVAK